MLALGAKKYIMDYVINKKVLKVEIPMPLSAGKKLPEVFLSDEARTQVISQMVKKEQVRKIGPRLYTSNMTESPKVIIQRNLWQVVALLAPGSVIGYRTALEGRPSEDGSIFVTSTYRRVLPLDEFSIISVKGAGPVEGDAPFIGGLFMASQARFLLENLLPTKSKGRDTRSVGRKEIEAKLTMILRVKGEKELNDIRDRARRVASELGMEKEFSILDNMIGALLRTRPASELTTLAALAYANGEAYDPQRLALFEDLRRALAAAVLPSRYRDHVPGVTFYNEGFFDAYFSNYIEGTEFEIDEAIGIVFSGVIPSNRPDDAHDILGTYRVVGNYEEMLRTPSDSDTFIEILQHRHAMILDGRPEKRPGLFKEKPNQAGSSVFVVPELVLGTLKQGFDLYRSLEDPLARALFMMFMVAEIHPFDDGNGRTARAMMNAELVSSSLCRIIIPSVFRNEYIASLKLLTNYSDPSSFLRVMTYAQEFVARIEFYELDRAKNLLESCNAFKDPADGIKLKMPV